MLPAHTLWGRPVVFALAFLLTARTAAAQPGREEAAIWCGGHHGAPAQVIAGCTWLILNASEDRAAIATAHARRGDARLFLYQQDAALEDFRSAASLDRRPAAVPLYRGRIHFVLQEYALAESAFSEAIRLSPQGAEGYRLRALTRTHLGNRRGSLDDYGEALRLEPWSAENWYLRGFERRWRSDWRGAMADYDQAIRLDPGHANAHATRANVRRILGDPDGARADADEAVRLDPDNLFGFNNRGFLRFWQRDYAGAIADHTEAIRINPGFVLAWSFRANARSWAGDIDGSLRDFSEAIRLDPAHLDARMGRAFNRRAIGDLDGAVDDYEVARGIRNSSETLAQLCITRFRLGQRQQAIQDCAEAERLSTRNEVWALVAWGGVSLLQGDLRGAMRPLNEASRRRTGDCLINGLNAIGQARFDNMSDTARTTRFDMSMPPWCEQLVRHVFGDELFRGWPNRSAALVQPSPAP